jgi:hypothetical protein
MQKLFKNWRKFRKNVLNEVTGHAPSDEYVERALGSETAEAHIRYLNTPAMLEHRQKVGLLLSLFDLTGITAYPHVYISYQDYKKNPTYGNAGWLALSLLSALPGAAIFAAPARVGKAARGAKALKLAKDVKPDEIADAAGEIAKFVRSAQGSSKGSRGADISAKIEKNIANIGKVVSKLPKQFIDLQKKLQSVKSGLKTIIINPLRAPKNVYVQTINAAQHLSKVDDPAKFLADIAIKAGRKTTGQGDVVLYRGIKGNKFNIIEVSDEAFESIMNIWRAAWKLSKETPKEALRGLVEEVTTLRRAGVGQFFSDSAKDAASYATKGDSIIVAIRVNSKKIAQHVNMQSSLTMGRAGYGTSFEIPAEILFEALEKGNISIVRTVLR